MLNKASAVFLMNGQFTKGRERLRANTDVARWKPETLSRSSLAMSQYQRRAPRMQRLTQTCPITVYPPFQPLSNFMGQSVVNFRPSPAFIRHQTR